ncbi:regulation of interleukin-18-mediated signaling pathway [Branchiostoma belcheri]|nr:regulation of interleukin-18-mediated signaling pathway [Branchiostoma belcheri]
MATNMEATSNPSSQPHKRPLRQCRSLPTDWRYDFCMWYHKDDQDTAQKIYRKLEEENYVGFIEHRDFQVGNDVFGNIEHGIDNSSKILVLLTQSSIQCRWFEKKVHTSLTKSLDDPQRRDSVIPVFDGIGKKDLPSSIRTLTGVDFRNRHFWNRLKQSLGSPMDTRALSRSVSSNT